MSTPFEMPTMSTSSSREGRHHHTNIELSELLSTSIDACRRGCEVIRNVRHKSLNNHPLNSVLYKIPDDPRSALTEADGASQRVIIECLTSCWEKEIDAGWIRIVGEEEDDHSTDLEGDKSFDTAYSEDILSHFDNYNAPRPDVEPIVTDMFREELTRATAGVGAHRNSTAKDEIIIFIDPMDGTREFVEGRIQNVQCLIGITLNGLPVAGAMGMPMVHEHQIEIAYGLISHENATGSSGSNEPLAESASAAVPLLSGVKFFDALNPLDVPPQEGNADRCDNTHNANKDNDCAETLMVYSGDSKKPALKLAMDCLRDRAHGGIEPANRPPIRKIVAGGCGSKMLSVSRHFISLSEQRRKRQDEQDSAAASSSSTSYPPLPMVGAISIAPPGSSSWDTAAPTAVLLAIDPQARVTDLLGRPLIYNGEDLLNTCGIVVSSGCVASRVHSRLCEGLCDEGTLRSIE